MHTRPPLRRWRQTAAAGTVALATLLGCASEGPTDSFASVTSDAQLPASTLLMGPPAPTTTLLMGPPAPTTTQVTSTTTSASIPVGEVELPMASTTVEVVDDTRVTDEVIGVDGEVVLAFAPERRIPTVVVRPDAASTHPLVIMMNGLGSLATDDDPLPLMLAEAGYIVASPMSPEVSFPASSAGDHPELHADIRVVVDALVDPSDGVADELAAVIDTEHIAAIGHSIGAAGVFSISHHPCCIDERIDAAIAIGGHPGAVPVPDSTYDFAIDTPLLLIHGDSDELAPPAIGHEVLSQAAPPTYLYVPIGADHFEPVWGGPSSPVARTTADTIIDFLDTHLLGTTTPEQLDARIDDLGGGAWTSASPPVTEIRPITRP